MLSTFPPNLISPFACWVVFYAFLLSSADFFEVKKLFQRHLLHLSECQTVWIPIRTDSLSVLPWVQTVCKVILANDKRANSDFIWLFLRPYMGVIPKTKMAFIFPISCILALIFPILIKYFPKCEGKGSFLKSQIKSLAKKTTVS